MSLRDQLVKAGLASRKDRQRAERELKDQRRKAQGHRDARTLVEQREQEERDRQRAERLQQRARERAARQAEAEAQARDLQVTHILRHHALRLRPGAQRFWHRTPDGRFLHRLDLPEWVAHDLRAGRLAVASVETAGDVDYVIVPREVAIRVHSLRPEALLFWNELPPSPEDPSERLLESSS